MKKEFKLVETKTYFYRSVDNKEFETQRDCEKHELLLKGLATICSRCNGCGYVNERPRYSNILEFVTHIEKEYEFLGMDKDNCDKCRTKGYIDNICKYSNKNELKPSLTRPH